MTTHLVTFATNDMSRAAELCVESAGRNGVDGYCVMESPSTVQILGHQYPTLLRLMATAPRGIGFWSWKPLIINNALNALPLDSYLIYADAGIEFIAPVQHIIDRMGHDKPQDDIFLFGNSWEHAHWCKRDVIDEVWPCNSESKCPSPHYETWDKFGKQVQASVIFFRVSDYSRAFVAEWLKWCLHDGGRLIDDSPSVLPNHPEFREHRHDQSILTTLAYREGILLHYWPGVYNRFLGQEFIYEKLPCYASDTYGPMFHHHRLRDHEWPSLQGVPWANLHPKHYK